MRINFPLHLKDAASKIRYMENPPTRQLTLFSEKGTVKAISNNKLILEAERAGLITIYVPNKIPCAPNDHVEITFELTEYGFIGRRVEKIPILPIDFLVLSEYLRFGFIAIIGMLGFLIIGIFFPVYFLSIILPVLLCFLWIYYHAGAVVVGRQVPNCNRAAISPFSAINPAQYSQFFVRGASPPLVAIEGTLNLAQDAPLKGLLLHEGREFPLISPVNTNLKKFKNLEGTWIVSFRKDQIAVLGKIQRGRDILWILNHLLSLRILFEASGYAVFFLSIIPGFLMYGFGIPVPFSGDLLTGLFIACMFVGCCLILVGKIAGLKKKRIQNNIVVEYKDA